MEIVKNLACWGTGKNRKCYQVKILKENGDGYTNYFVIKSGMSSGDKTMGLKVFNSFTEAIINYNDIMKQDNKKDNQIEAKNNTPE